MEWKKVRNWLILLVLAVDLFLAGNLAMQVLQAQQTARQAAADAVAVAQRRGVNVRLEDVLQMPLEMSRYQAQRSDGMEQAAANVLLGGTTVQELPGGGVSIYRADEGEMSFRRGGALEMTGPWTGMTFDRKECALVLESAGFSMEDAVIRDQNGAVELMQGYEKLPVFNCRVICLQQDGGLQVRGRWMLASEPVSAAGGMSRAQMVLAMCDLMESRQVERLYSVQAGYYLQSEDAQSLTLEPVWSVETDQGQLILSCVTGEQVNF